MDLCMSLVAVVTESVISGLNYQSVSPTKAPINVHLTLVVHLTRKLGLFAHQVHMPGKFAKGSFRGGNTENRYA